MEPRKINELGIDLLKTFEGLKLKAYKDSAGIWTIGYGHTGPDVLEGLEISREEAEALLASDVHHAQKVVSDQTRDFGIDINQFSALVCFVFNVGEGNFYSSTMLKKLRQGRIDEVDEEFGRWVYATDPASRQKIKLRGLVRRRAAEAALFLKPVATTQIVPSYCTHLHDPDAVDP